MSSENEEYVSLKPSDAVKGGGAIEPGRYKIVDAKFDYHDYGGTVTPPAPSLMVAFQNAENAVKIQAYSAGSEKNLAPSADKKRLRKVGSTGGLNDSTNCYTFMKAMVNAGFPEDKLGEDISVLIGLDVDVVHEATAARDIGGKKVPGKNLPVIGKFHNLGAITGPGTPAGKKSTAAKKTNGSEGAVTEELKVKAINVLTTALKEAPDNRIEKKQVTTAVFKHVPVSDPDRSPLLNLVIREDFLGSLEGQQIAFDPAGGMIFYLGA